jgi:gliding motility-associated-like protein
MMQYFEMKKLIQILLFLTPILFCNESQILAQIAGIGNDKTDTTADGNLIYVYNASEINNNLFTRLGGLEAISQDGTNGWIFVWSKFDFSSKKFVVFDSSLINNDFKSVKNNLYNGGYQVRMMKDTIDTTFTAWVFINRLRMHLRKDKKGVMKYYDNGCSFVRIGAEQYNKPDNDSSKAFIHSRLSYFNLKTSKQVDVADTSKFRFKTSKGDFRSYINKPETFDYNPSTDTLDYMVSFVDKYGNSAFDTLTYNPIRTKADFEYLLYNYSDLTKKYEPLISFDKPDSAGEAPLKARFINKSLNGGRHGELSYEWFLVDTFKIDNQHFNSIDSIHVLTSKLEDTAEYKYYLPATYNVKLVSTGPDEICHDTVVKVITAVESQVGGVTFSFPNAFTPNGDGKNDYFIFKDDSAKIDSGYLSIRSFHFFVYNSWGRLVYEYKGPLNRGYKGWNGRINGKEANPGIYYYVYYAKGWGPIKSKDPVGKRKFTHEGSGFVYLFRNQ